MDSKYLIDFLENNNYCNGMNCLIEITFQLSLSGTLGWENRIYCHDSREMSSISNQNQRLEWNLLHAV